MLQIQKDHVGLTGSHMFLMTRRFLLTVCTILFVFAIILLILM